MPISRELLAIYEICFIVNEMKFYDARQYALEFWQQPEGTPFSADVQDKLLGSHTADLRHMSAMSVVYNGLLARDNAYIEVAEEILHCIGPETAPTSTAVKVARDINYMGLFRAIIDPSLEHNFSTLPKAALSACLNMRSKLRDREGFDAGGASGVLSEAIAMHLLNRAGFKTVPSMPWHDRPHGVAYDVPNIAFDAFVLTNNVSKSKVQIKSTLGMPPTGASHAVSEQWLSYPLSTRRQIVASHYAGDIALLVLETDLDIPPRSQVMYADCLLLDTTPVSEAWELHAMNSVTEAIW
jgi:hypothetical protein